MCNIIIPIGNTNYEFYNIPDKVVMAIITLLQECENCESKIISAESEK